MNRYNLCSASGQQYLNYAGVYHPDDENKMPCPVCGKTVKLRALYPKSRQQPAQKFIVIPFHESTKAKNGSTANQ
jgi:hypothetical protein